MREKYLPAIALLGVIVGASGLGLGAFTAMQVQTGAVEGDDGDDGDDGIIGEKGDDAPGGIMVGILDPDEGETVSGNITIRAMVSGSDDYTIKVLINGSLNATYVPFEWDTTKLSDGWWNVTVIATEFTTNDISQDEVIVDVDNISPNAKVYRELNYDIDPYTIPPVEIVDFDMEKYDPENCFDTDTDRYTVKKDGYYLIMGQVLLSMLDGELIAVSYIATAQGGGTIDTAQNYGTGGTTPSTMALITGIVYLSAGDYISLHLKHYGAGPRTLNGLEKHTWFSITYIG